MNYKLKLFALLPGLAIRREKHLNYVKKDMPSISDLDIRRASQLPYDPKGHYPCMFHTPPRHYQRQLAARRFDEQGVPRFLYQGQLHYHPTGIAQYGLSEFGYWLSSGKQQHLDRAWAAAQWLQDNQDPASGAWLFSFDLYHKRADNLLKAPWTSAMAQGLGISLLTRLYHQSGEPGLLDCARSAARILKVPVDQGGCCSTLCGHPVYEEYPTQPPSFTLNGFIFCLFGVYDLACILDQPGIQQLWEAGRESLAFMVPLFDNDFISSYDLTHVFSPVGEKQQALRYHLLHITLLQHLQAIDPRPVYARYIKKWAAACGIRLPAAPASKERR